MLITFEGIDGAGKTTQMKKIEEAMFGTDNLAYFTREPFTPESYAFLRDTKRTNEEKLLVLLQDRAEHHKLIQQYEKKYKIVFCDRYIHSTIAYQTTCEYSTISRGFDMEKFIKTINDLFVQPKYTFYIDIDIESAKMRCRHRQNDMLLFSGNSGRYMKDVLMAYKRIFLAATMYSKNKPFQGGGNYWINGNINVDEVFDSIYAIIKDIYLVEFQEKIPTIGSLEPVAK